MALSKRSVGDEADAVPWTISSSLLLKLLLLLLTVVKDWSGGRWSLSLSGGSCSPHADASRLARQKTIEGGAERFAEECVDYGIGRRRDVTPPDYRRDDVHVAEPAAETRRTEDRDDVDQEERSPEHGESQQNNSEHLGRLQNTVLS